MKKRMAQRMMPAAKRRLRAGGDLGPAVEGLGGAAQPAVHRPHHVRQLEARLDVELGSEAHLEVAHALGLAVLGQLEGGALEGLRVLQDRHRVLEALRGTPRRLGSAGRNTSASRSPSGVSEGRPTRRSRASSISVREAQRAVQVDVEVGLGQPADQVQLSMTRIMPRPGTWVNHDCSA